MSKRVIKTVYYDGRKQVVKTTRSSYPRSATMRAFDHMQVDEYSAAVCEVYDAREGTLHAVFTRTPKTTTVVFKRDPTLYIRGGTHRPKKVSK